MILEANTDKLSDGVVKDCVTLETIDENDIQESTYEFLEEWMQDSGLIGIVMEEAIKKLNKMNITVLR